MIATIVAALYSFHIDSYNQFRLFNDLFSGAMALISCSNIGCRKTFRMEKKRHLESGKCVGVPPDPVNLSEMLDVVLLPKLKMPKF